MVGRLFQIVYLLMENEQLSARELARRLEVSVRTINRDIEKLSEARIPIYTTRGRDGGISLLPEYVLNKTVLSEEEKSGILSSMRLMGTVAYDDEKEALQRLEDFFGEAAQDWVEIELDNWGEGSFDKARFGQLKQAVLTRKKVTFDYMKQGDVSHRKVRPAKLVFRAQAWYLYAFCEKRQDFRYFKLRRMNHLEVTDERFAPLALPKEEPKHYVSHTKTFCAEVAIDKCMAYRAFDELNPTHVIEKADCFVFTIDDADENWFVTHMLSYGQYAQILSPADIRDAMIHVIEEMAEKYRT
ncbi:MAG: YafY family protein [bacterium]|nr:YafY family protein [bacterium]